MYLQSADDRLGLSLAEVEGALREDEPQHRGLPVASQIHGQERFPIDIKSNNTSKQRYRTMPTHYPLTQQPYQNGYQVEIPQFSNQASARNSMQRKSNSFDPVTRISPREIHPASLDALGIQWDWDPSNDHWLYVPHITDEQMRLLRKHTEEHHEESTNSARQSSATLWPRKPQQVEGTAMPSDRFAAAERDSAASLNQPPRLAQPGAYHKDNSLKTQTEDAQPSNQQQTSNMLKPSITARSALHERARATRLNVHYEDSINQQQRANFEGEKSVPDAKRLKHSEEAQEAIERVEDLYKSQVDHEHKMAAKCRALEHEFEAYVQNLMWDEPLENFEEIIHALRTSQDVFLDECAQNAINLDGAPDLRPQINARKAYYSGDTNDEANFSCCLKVEKNGILLPCTTKVGSAEELHKHEQRHLQRNPYKAAAARRPVGPSQSHHEDRTQQEAGVRPPFPRQALHPTPPSRDEFSREEVRIAAPLVRRALRQIPEEREEIIINRVDDRPSQRRPALGRQNSTSANTRRTVYPVRRGEPPKRIVIEPEPIIIRERGRRPPSPLSRHRSRYDDRSYYDDFYDDGYVDPYEPHEAFRDRRSIRDSTRDTVYTIDD